MDLRVKLGALHQVGTPVCPVPLPMAGPSNEISLGPSAIHTAAHFTTTGAMANLRDLTQSYLHLFSLIYKPNGQRLTVQNGLLNLG